VVCASFVSGRAHGLQPLKPGTLYLPGSTSLRMGPLGYQSEAQASLAVSYNSLESYARSLHGALTEPYPPYEAIGVRHGDDYRQLAASLLQIENEFYGTIRPKRRIRPGERPLHALAERGVEYVEVRCMDLDPLCPIGITAATIRFLDVFLLHCLLSGSPRDTPEEIAANSRNQHMTAQRGRDPAIRLTRNGEEVSLSEWGAQLLRECGPIAAALDGAYGAAMHRDALSAAAAALADSALTPSARILREVAQPGRRSYPDFVLAHSQQHRSHLLELPLDAEAEARYARIAAESLARQRQIEAADTVPFESYRRQYLSQDLLGGMRLE
jgi:glutamate--cysteine ligase